MPSALALRSRLFLSFAALAALAALPVLTAAQGSSNDRPQANWELSNKFTTQALQRVIYSTTLAPRWIGKTRWPSFANRSAFSTPLSSGNSK